MKDNVRTRTPLTVDRTDIDPINMLERTESCGGCGDNRLLASQISYKTS